MTELDPVRRANVIGLGLIGGSVALALRERGWHVSGEDIDTATASAALDRGVVDAIGLDNRRRDHVRGGAGVDRCRPGQAGPRRDEWRRHRRRQRQGGRLRRRRRHPVRRWAPDGGIGTRRTRRRPGRPVRGGGVGAHARPRQRRRRVRPGGIRRRVLRCRGRRTEPGTPRPARRGGQPRSAPHRGHADGARERTRRGARCAAAPRRRRLPRHDQGGERASGDLARHLRREPHRHRRRARPAHRRTGRGSRHHRLRRPRGPACPPHRGPTRPRQPADPRRASRRTRRGPHPHSRPCRRCSRGVHPGRRTQRQHRQLRSRPHRREHAGVAVVLVDRAMVELFRGGLLARGFRPAVQPLS